MKFSLCKIKVKLKVTAITVNTQARDIGNMLGAFKDLLCSKINYTGIIGLGPPAVSYNYNNMNTLACVHVQYYVMV